MSMVRLSQLTFVALAMTTALNAQATSKSTVCGGCSEVALLESKFRQLKAGDDDKAVPLLIEASAAVKRMPLQKGKKLTADQVKTVVDLLASAFENDPDYAIIDNNFKVVESNQAEFYAAAKALPAKDADNVKSELDIKLSEASSGQDPDEEPTSKAAKAAKHKK